MTHNYNTIGNKKMKIRPSIIIFISIVAVIFISIICYWTVFTTNKTINIPGEGIYTGQVKNGYFNGTGTWQSVTGVIYTGEFKDGMYEGQGTMTFVNGSAYTGGFKEGYMHGHGIMTFPDGSTHEGEWDANQLIAEEETHSHDHDHKH